jgi:RNA polymerase sigma-70 factor (ECF subfamily)
MTTHRSHASFVSHGDDLCEADLIAALRTGQPGSAEVLYRRLIFAVRGAVRSVLRYRHEDCDDLVQISFERIIATLVQGSYRGDCRLRHWAASIATHAAIDHQRALIRERNVLCSDDAQSLAAPSSTRAQTERSLIARSELERLRNIMSRMRPVDCEVLILRHGLGYSLGEIAVALGVSEVAAASRLVRARREMLRRAGGKGKTVPPDSGSFAPTELRPASATP